jgi:hypothetical protein
VQSLHGCTDPVLQVPAIKTVDLSLVAGSHTHNRPLEGLASASARLYLQVCLLLQQGLDVRVRLRHIGADPVEVVQQVLLLLDAQPHIAWQRETKSDGWYTSLPRLHVCQTVDPPWTSRDSSSSGSCARYLNFRPSFRQICPDASVSTPRRTDHRERHQTITHTTGGIKPYLQ